MNRFLHSDPLAVGDCDYFAKDILATLGTSMTEARKNRIAEVVARRTYSVVTVLEDIYDRGNASAVMRSSEAMGFQAVHLIEKGERFKKANRVTQGADKWLDVVRWKETAPCVEQLKSQGYQILATHLDETAVSIDAVDFSKPTAMVFGNEKDGISTEMQKLADRRVIIPMYGFVQSFNISVAAAVALHQIFLSRKTLGLTSELGLHEREILSALFYLRSFDNPEAILARTGCGRPREKEFS